MKVNVNGTAYDIPFTLPGIQLGQFIEYHEQYGNDLDKDLDELLKKDYQQDGLDAEDIEILRQMDLEDHIDKEALAWFAYWTKSDYEDVTSHPGISKYLIQYRVLKHLLNNEQNAAYNLPTEIEWNGKIYAIQNYTINAASEMNFNEVITSKEIVRQIRALGKGRWDALPYLCAVFFREKDQPFTDEMVQDQHVQIMHTLPMNYALMVTFFLTACVSTWNNTSAYLEERAAEIANLN